jgi:hypothetical protein
LGANTELPKLSQGIDLSKVPKTDKSSPRCGHRYGYHTGEILREEGSRRQTRLSREERSAIYQTLKGQLGGRALKADIGTKVPLGIELRPVPDELIVRVPQTRGYDYTVAGDTVLLVSPLTRAVVGVFSDRD